MKKIYGFLLVAIVAIGFSAFTPNKADGVFYYPPGEAELEKTSATPCPWGMALGCEAEIPELDGEPILPIFYENGDPYEKPL